MPNFKSNIAMRQSFSAVILLIALFASGCNGYQVIEPPPPPKGNRVVVIEEFTGKGCTNCPKGSRELENLLSQFPNNLTVVSIHAGFFANPQFFPLGEYDLRTPEGEDLYNFLGPPLFYPAAAVDRLIVNGDRMLGLNQWASVVTAEVQEDPAIDVSVETTYDPDTRQLEVAVGGIGKTEVTGDIRISVMITESGIVDAQDDAEAVPNIVPDYVHKHVLRDMMTASRGDVLASSIALGESFARNYTLTLPTEWVAENMEVIAFVNVVSGNQLDVIQAAHAPVVD
jgi:hypothetical protein